MTTTTSPTTREQLVAALSLCLAQLRLYAGKHDSATQQIIAECQLVLREAKPKPNSK